MTGFVCRNCGEIESQPVSFKRVSAIAIDRHNQTAAELAAVLQTASGNDTEEPDENGNDMSTWHEKSEEKHGLLHTAEVIERGAEFGLEIILSSSTRSSTLNQLTKLLTRSLEDEGVGASKSRGLGTLKVKDVRIEEITPETIEKRALELFHNMN
jgi:CRISPR/Cas system CSM-associated protein Csm3 (group 7 of RAMP superfamily)